MDYEKGYVYELMDQGGPTDVREAYCKDAVDKMMRWQRLLTWIRSKDTIIGQTNNQYSLQHGDQHLSLNSYIVKSWIAHKIEILSIQIEHQNFSKLTIRGCCEKSQALFFAPKFSLRIFHIFCRITCRINWSLFKLTSSFSD